MKIVITPQHFDPKVVELLRNAGHEVVPFVGKIGTASSEEEVYEIVKDADIIIAALENYTESLLRRLPNLKLISRCGIGYDAIDVSALEKLGIGLTRATGFVEGAVAEHVMAYILYFAKMLHVQSDSMHAHEWKPFLPPGAKGRTLGLVGFGGIGKEIALRAKPFGMNILYYCRHPNPEDEAKYGAKSVTLEELLQNSDYVSLNVPLTDETHHLFDNSMISKMKKGSYLINIARGPVVNEAALAESLLSGHLAGAGIDVFEKEPTVDSPLMDCPTAVLTPHTASLTLENYAEMNRAAAENVLNYLAGMVEDKYIVTRGNRR